MASKDLEIKWLRTFEAMMESFGVMASTVQAFDDHIQKIPDNQISLINDIKVLNTSVTELQTALESYVNTKTVDNSSHHKILDDLHSSVKVLNDLLEKFDPSVSSGNRAILEVVQCAVTDNEVKILVTSVNEIIKKTKDVMKEMSIIMKNKKETFELVELYEVMTFAKKGNAIIEWCEEKHKFIKFLCVLFGLLMAAPTVFVVIKAVLDTAGKH